ncbi:MAG: DUF2783 domain-containing protein [Aestuariivita sp.]|nr:DUF2783 domain-containing protein [Aestuariivita sp.]
MATFPDQLSSYQDDFYDTLPEAHTELSEADSHALNARLILMLANIIGDRHTLRNVIKAMKLYQ